jgi:hypothetical protein
MIAPTDEQNWRIRTSETQKRQHMLQSRCSTRGSSSREHPGTAGETEKWRPTGADEREATVRSIALAEERMPTDVMMPSDAESKDL